MVCAKFQDNPTSKAWMFSSHFGGYQTLSCLKGCKNNTTCKVITFWIHVGKQLTCLNLRWRRYSRFWFVKYYFTVPSDSHGLIIKQWTPGNKRKKTPHHNMATSFFHHIILYLFAVRLWVFVVVTLCHFVVTLCLFLLMLCLLEVASCLFAVVLCLIVILLSLFVLALCLFVVVSPLYSYFVSLQSICVYLCLYVVCLYCFVVALWLFVVVLLLYGFFVYLCCYFVSPCSCFVSLCSHVSLSLLSLVVTCCHYVSLGWFVSLLPMCVECQHKTLPVQLSIHVHIRLKPELFGWNLCSLPA